MPTTLDELRNPYRIVVDAHLEDLEDCVPELEASRGIPAEHRRHAIAACELTRDVLFGLGLPKLYDDEYLRRIEVLFGKVAEAIVSGDDEQVAGFKKHIEDRRQKIAAYLPKAVPSE